MENITLQNNGIHVDISPMGAEMQRIIDKDGHERLWHGDPAFWTGRAPILFPHAGAMRNERYTLDGVSYTLPRHGFARKSLFTLSAQQPEHAAFVLRGHEHPHAGFPFDYVFTVAYQLRGNSIEVSYITENHDSRPFYFGVGCHEAYACPEGIEAYEVVFDTPEPLVRTVLDGPFMTHKTEPVDAPGSVLALRPSLFANDTLVLAGLAPRSVTLRSKLHGRITRLDYPDFDNLLIWTVPGAGYICLEPWTNLPDYVDSSEDVTQKPGMRKLAPGESWTARHTMTFA